jgi:ABC-type uncharacterized transport system auxiliary subunit
MRRTGARHRARWRGAALLSMLAFLPGCGGRPPALRHYELVVSGARRPPVDGGTTLAVAALVADSAYDTDRMVYRLSPYRLDYYEYHRWSAHPGLLLADYLRKAYARTGLFRAVVSEPDTEAWVVLAGRIAALDEIDESPERWLARVALELSLRDAGSGARLWSAVYERRDPMRERSPEGLARALSAALAGIVAESAPALARHAAAAADAAREAPRAADPVGAGEEAR